MTYNIEGKYVYLVSLLSVCVSLLVQCQIELFKFPLQTTLRRQHRVLLSSYTRAKQSINMFMTNTQLLPSCPEGRHLPCHCSH